MNPAAQIDDLTFAHPGADLPALEQLSLTPDFENSPLQLAWKSMVVAAGSAVVAAVELTRFGPFTSTVVRPAAAR